MYNKNQICLNNNRGFIHIDAGKQDKEAGQSTKFKRIYKIIYRFIKRKKRSNKQNRKTKSLGSETDADQLV